MTRARDAAAKQTGAANRDLSERMGLRLPRAIAAKMEFNEARPHKHGGKVF